MGNWYFALLLTSALRSIMPGSVGVQGDPGGAGEGRGIKKPIIQSEKLNRNPQRLQHLEE